jgi:hypothetical protein
MTMARSELDNGEWMMRRYWEAPSLTPRAWTAGEPEPEDTSGLKMLEKLLAKRKGARDGDGDERK